MNVGQLKNMLAKLNDNIPVATWHTHDDRVSNRVRLSWLPTENCLLIANFHLGTPMSSEEQLDMFEGDTDDPKNHTGPV